MRRLAGAVGLLMAAAVLPAAPAIAHQAPPELAERFARGDYMEAAKEAEASADADDLAFAARALLAQCMTGTTEPDAAVVDRASKDAEAALKIDPQHEEGRLQLAIALSLKSRAMDLLDAWNAGYGEQGRKLAMDVLKSDPRNFYAHGFLAVWNVEVRRRGGALGAAFMGASLKEARRQYDEAARLAPDDVGVHWQYARALAALDLRAHEKEVAEVLEHAVAAHAGNHVERVMQERAMKLAAALKGEWRSAQVLARELL